MEKRCRFRSYDGTNLEGTLTTGASAQSSVVILVHGITSSRDEFGLYSGFASYLANEGIPSLRFDYRCHGVNKQPMEELTLSGVVNDIEAAAQCALVETSATTCQVVGMSFGGGLSAFWAATTKVNVSAVVMFAPVIDYEEDILGQHGLLSNGTLSRAAQKSLEDVGFLNADDIRYGGALLNEIPYISGIVALRRLQCRSLIVHGDADSVVPYESSKRFAQLNPQCRLINIPGTDHGFGVDEDEDLSSPATKAKHQEVFRIASVFLKELGPHDRAQ